MIYKIIKAKPGHSIFFYKLRNSNYIRRCSLNNKKLNFDDHQKWFREKIKLKNYFFYILKKDEKKIGYIRLKKN